MSPRDLLSRLERWTSAEYTAVVFESESEPVGYALFRASDPDLKHPHGVYLRQFYVSRSHRRRRLGTRAMELLLQHVFDGRRVMLEALNSNPTGHAFWQALGFEPYSVRYDRVADPGS